MFKVNRWIIVTILMSALALTMVKKGETATHNVPGDFNTIQEAINNAVNGDTVLVHDGTYYENIDFSGKAITVRSENGAATTIIDGGSIDVVVDFHSYEGGDSVLDGFSITNGYYPIGGGIACYSSSPTIKNCIVSGNTSSSKGGGIILWTGCSPMIVNCTIKNNSAGPALGGGGILSYQSSPTILHCTIRENTTGGDGGGIASYDSVVTVKNCTIEGNRALSGYGGGIFCDNSELTIVSCIISDNINELYDGGGVYAGNTVPLMIANSTITKNTAVMGEGGGIYSYISSPTVVNSILWGDMASGVPNEIGFAKSNNTVITYSDVEGGYTGFGNINADPLFLDPANRDYHLQPGSPCIDAANSDLPAPDVDIDANARYDDPATPNTGTGAFGDYYDMGSDEFTGAACTDSDNDGYFANPGCGTEVDCNDSDIDVNPGATEICDGIDNNCSGSADEGLINTYYLDADGDGYGDPNVSIEDCTIPSAGYVTDNTDCDDNNDSAYPGATEVCDGVDNDCNGHIDEGVNTAYYRDADGDGYGDHYNHVMACSIPAGYVENYADCDDTNPYINPAACDIKRNGIDEDCDGSDRQSGPACPAGDPEICNDGVDNDGDGDIDCADADCTNNPACGGGGCVPVPEICFDGIDNDCDGKADCADKKDCKNFPGC